MEGMTREVIVNALKQAGAEFEGEHTAERASQITKADLFLAGLSGAGSAERRRALKQRLDLPEHLSPNALLDVSNILYTREEFLELVHGEPL